jgi:hypothetical protein
MKRLGLLLLFALISCQALSGQWLNYPTPGVPRTPDGRPDLSAPAPRTADGKVDLTVCGRSRTNGACGSPATTSRIRHR